MTMRMIFLGRVSPIAKVDTLDVQLAKFLPSCCFGDEQGQQSILDISMTPVLPLEARYGGDVAGPKRTCRANNEEDDH